MPTDPARPLAGIRVIDLTNVLAGPFACHQLAHLGAEVIKVETPGRGDLARSLGADPDLNADGMGISFLAQNAGKKSITVNLKSGAGRDILYRLVRASDVLVENFRPGVMDRLGLSYDRLKAENPRLICCSISGFGQTGPWKNRPAYDQIVQGLSGVMSITGTPGSAPLRVGYPLADTIGGLTAAMAIAAALNACPRGCHIDVSMLDAVLATMGWVVSNHLIGGVTPEPHGNENVTSAPSGTFETRDGLLNIAANKPEQWQALARHLGREDLLEHPDYTTREDRKRNRKTLKAELETVLTRRAARDWAAELTAIGVPAGEVLSLPEILAHPQVTGRDLIATFRDVPGVGRDIDILRIAARLNGITPSVAAPPPQLGQDTDDILRQLEFSDEQIGRMRRDGTL